ncbi:4-coumarate--CoA ligase-like 7 [Grifola frondosa]|uniref:4-coumarate--CoA ligase-like 7 n=1 Tax=Grifola frondosa TaxID=5627 RepID=A0A1C7MMD4_GRIFR|nr:4-coumarate--CoA ligase-like 7 [Grifola frondosa]
MPLRNACGRFAYSGIRSVKYKIPACWPVLTLVLTPFPSCADLPASSGLSSKKLSEMAEIHGDGGPLPFIPDDLTVPQFILDSHHPSRPVVKEPHAWLIEDHTGRRIGSDELHWRKCVVCIFGPNHVDYPVAIWATHRLGAIVTGANPAYTAEELEHQLVTTNTRVMIVHPTNLSIALEAARSAGIPPDRLVLFDPVQGADLRRTPAHGTTGKPKAVAIAHYSLIANVIQMAHYTKPVLPFYHIYGLVVVLHFHLFCGFSLVVVPKFNFTDILKSIQRYRITHLAVVPPMVVLLCKHPAVKEYDLSSVKLVMCGAAPLSAELTNQLSQVLPLTAIGQGYGMTETCTTVTFPQMNAKIGTVGSAGTLLPGIVARVVKQDGSLAGYNEPGQLVVKGPAMALGYFDNEQATKETFQDGWVVTGDEVMINEQKDLFVVDRIKELIKVRGFQVAPAELEGHILDHPDVSDVCVVGLPDEYSGELPLAFVVLSASAQERLNRNSAEAAKIRATVSKHVSDAKVRYKWLAGVEFIEAIPKNPSGKLLRRFLRDRAKEMRANGTLATPIKSKL